MESPSAASGSGRADDRSSLALGIDVKNPRSRRAAGLSAEPVVAVALLAAGLGASARRLLCLALPAAYLVRAPPPRAQALLKRDRSLLLGGGSTRCAARAGGGFGLLAAPAARARRRHRFRLRAHGWRRRFRAAADPAVLDGRPLRSDGTSHRDPDRPPRASPISPPGWSILSCRWCWRCRWCWASRSARRSLTRCPRRGCGGCSAASWSCRVWPWLPASPRGCFSGDSG